MILSAPRIALGLGLGALLLTGCQFGEEERCGPTSGTVARVIDGDTIELTSGERIRYLMVDTPETSGGVECWGEEAKQYNTDLVAGKDITLVYDTECKDRFDRTLAYVYLGDREINSLLIQNGFACVLHIPPNGTDRKSEFESLEAIAQQQGLGLWGQCTDNPC